MKLIPDDAVTALREANNFFKAVMQFSVEVLKSFKDLNDDGSVLNKMGRKSCTGSFTKNCYKIM